MKNKIKGLTALTLAVVMSAQVFAGCSSSGNNSKDQEEQSPVKAAPVAFSENGEYKTTITSSKIDLSDIKAEDVSVTYDFMDENAYNKAVDRAKKEQEKKLLSLVKNKAESDTEDKSESETKADNKSVAEAAAEALGDDDVSEINVNIGDYMKEKDAEVKSVKAGKDKLELSFTDPEASKNLTCYYYINIKDKKYQDEDIVIDLGVDFKKYELTPNINSVVSNAKETRLTLKLNEGSFAHKVTKNDITLSGSFEKMKIDSLSCSGKNLTMQLVGKPIKPYGLTTYVDGVVSVRPQAIKDAGSDVKVYIPIELAGKSFDASTIKADGDKVTAEVELLGTANSLDEMTAEDFKFERDVTVTGVEKTGNTRVKLTMTVKGATDASTAAAVLNNQKLKIADEGEILVSASETHFYPVFDGIEKSGDDLKFTINAYADNGTFSKDIKPEQIALGGDFKKGSLQSVERENDSTAKIVYTIPADGQTAESIDSDGKITIKAGAMVSQWGEPTTEDFSYTRNYSQESLGRVGGTPKRENFSFSHNVNSEVYLQTQILQ